MFVPVFDYFLRTASMHIKRTNGTVKVLRSDRPGATPKPSQGLPGEWVVNTNDRRVWIVDDKGVPVEIELKVKKVIDQ